MSAVGIAAQNEIEHEELEFQITEKIKQYMKEPEENYKLVDTKDLGSNRCNNKDRLEYPWRFRNNRTS